MDAKKILIVPYCHPDWAWTFYRRWHEKRYVLAMEEVLDIMKDHPDYRWYLDTYITEVEPFLRRRPERVKELRKRIKEGKIAICGTFTNLRPSMVGEESQARDIIIGREKYAQVLPEADLSVYASTVDVSVGHPQMPQLLSLGGYRYYRFWRPHAALSAKRVPLEFFWQGLDGSRILCSRGCYGGLSSGTNVSEMLERELAYNVELSPTGIRWFNQGMDDTRPLRTGYEDQPIPMFESMKEWNATKPARVRFATPLEAFREIEQEKDKIPVVAESLDPCEVCYNAGWGGNHGLFHLRQVNERGLVELERWCAVAADYGRPYPALAIRKFWEEHLLVCAHATQWLFTEDFEELKRRGEWVKLAAERMKKETIEHLARRITVSDAAEEVLFNQLPYEREEKVDLAISFHDGRRKNFLLSDGRNRNIPYQVRDINHGENHEWEYRVTAKVTLPAGGYTTVLVKKGAAAPAPVRAPFEAVWTGHEITAVNGPAGGYRAEPDSGFGAVRLHLVDTTKGMLHVGPITSVEPAVWEKTVLQEDGCLYLRYSSEGCAGPHRLIRDILVHRDEPRLEFRLEVDWREEDGFLTIEWPRLPGVPLYGEVPFGVEEKDLSREPFGKLPGSEWDVIERQRDNLFYAKTFVSQSEGGRGLSYVNHDATRYYRLKDSAVENILLNSVTKLTGWERFVTPAMKGGGRHTFVSHLIFHAGDWKAAHLARRAQSLGCPPARCFVDRPARAGLPAAHSFAAVRPENLSPTAYYREGSEHVLRFYESEGKRTRAAITLDRAAGNVRKTDLNGLTLAKLPPGKTVRLSVRPREIVTLRWK